MADIDIFFEEGIKSYIDQSFSKYSKDNDIIFHRKFDNNVIHPLFINDISLFKNIIQKNKLKSEIWCLIVGLFEQKINLLLNQYDESIKNMRKNVLKYTEQIKKSHEKIQKYREEKKEARQQIKNNNNSLNKDNSDDENIINIDENENLSDVKCQDYISKNNADLIKKIGKYDEKKEKEKKLLAEYESILRQKEKYVICGEISSLKLKILQISIIILINEIGNQNLINNEYNKENNYKLLNDYICDFIDKCEKTKDKIYIKYTTFIRTYVIQSALIINNQGYKDINISFLNQILTTINSIKKTYSNSRIVDLIKNIEKLISKPDTFLCRNAFTILKDASFKKIKPRSRNNSFDKNDVVYNNTNNKNEKNRKIDEFINRNRKEEKSDSDDDEDDFQKKFSNVISFKNSSLQNNNNSNTNIIPNNNNFYFQSQSSLGLVDINKNRSLPNESAFSNNSLICIENPNGTNLLNSSKVSIDDSMSVQMYRSGSCSDLLGINSRLASQLPVVRNTKQEKAKNNIFTKFGKKIKIRKINLERKRSNEKLDNIFGKEIRKIVNNNFYNNNDGSTYDKQKNTTATETKKSQIIDGKNNINKIKSDILAVKTPVKNSNENTKEKEEVIYKNILKESGIKKNLELLFNQQSDKY